MISSLLLHRYFLSFDCKSVLSVSPSTQRQCNYGGAEEEKCQDPFRESAAASQQRR